MRDFSVPLAPLVAHYGDDYASAYAEAWKTLPAHRCEREALVRSEVAHWCALRHVHRQRMGALDWPSCVPFHVPPHPPLRMARAFASEMAMFGASIAKDAARYAARCVKQEEVSA